MLSAQDLASITTTVASSLDNSLPLQRNTPGIDTSGHATVSWASVGNVQCNVIKPSATVLQAFADIIGSQRALTLRVMQTTDIRMGDKITYDNVDWLINNLLDGSSYSVTKRYLMTTVAKA